MDESPNIIDSAEDTGSANDRTSDDARPPARGGGWGRRILLAFAIVLGALVLGWLLDRASASPRLCASCHEMQARATSWEESAHNTVACVECHQEPHPWYAVPQRLVDRAGLLVRDVTAHFEGEYVESSDSGAKESRITDTVCLQCHDPGRTATSGYRILIDHVEHAKRNGSCVSCHIRTAHPVESRGRAITLMAQCFECHGSSEQPDAGDACELCHPVDYELVPASHAPDVWDIAHGETAVDDPKQCTMCHDVVTCDSCHGIEMPHPDGWAKGATGHSAIALTDRAVCSQCHGDQLEMCTMCHHTGYDPMQGSWVQHHFIEVRERGAGSCIERCHSPVFCITCHAR